MAVWSTGAGGQLGAAVVACAGGRAVLPLGRAELDVTDPRAVGEALAHHRPRAVLNCAAWTDVDGAESASGQAFAVNRDGAAHLAGACRAAGVPLVHVSTDYVFDGAAAEPRQPGDPVAPLSVYGASKWAGEEAVRGAGGLASIVRTSWLFSGAQGFVVRVLRAARTRPEVPVVDDQRGGPTCAADLARALWRVVERPVPGTFHFQGRPSATWFEVARHAVAALGPGAGRVFAVPTSHWPTAARRPAHSVLDCAGFTATWGVEMPDWRPAVERIAAGFAA